MTGIIDDANERAAKWLNAQIEEHQYQMGHAVSAFEVGRCRNLTKRNAWWQVGQSNNRKQGKRDEA